MWGRERERGARRALPGLPAGRREREEEPRGAVKDQGRTRQGELRSRDKSFLCGQPTGVSLGRGADGAVGLQVG